MSRVGAVILAAGASRRFGEAKQLALLAGETLLARAVRMAGEAGCKPVVVVLGAGAAEIGAECGLRRAVIVVNEGWAEGMASSIRAGVGCLVDKVDGVILMTCDQPGVDAGHLRRLMARDAAERTASSYAERRGVPAYFPAGDFSRLLTLKGDEGARELLAEAASIELPGGELDVDTLELLALARARYGRGGAPQD